MKVAPLAISIVSATLATAATILFLTERNAHLATEGKLAQAKADISSLEGSTRAARESQAQAQKQAAAAEQAGSALRTQLAASESRAADTAQKLGLAQNLLNLRDENERTLNREIASLNRNLNSANLRLNEMETLRAHNEELEQALALARNPNAPDGRPTAASAQSPRKVLALGPSDSFIVVNYGTRDNAAAGQRLIIRRGTNLIGTALISTPLEDVSVAQVDPHSLREALRTGDAIILAP